uniref:Uncharacterized protein n=1 Tax=Pithovirus LCPAC302 TaxID=2506593 RepID=A0A481Z714_9VIRU|nr:MAG: hypothetical protein LCPAC302_01770 [Pithovirus LCPAC302]
MSTTPFYTTTPLSTDQCPSVVPWIVVIILLILVIIGLAIWLIVRHVQDSDNDNAKLLNLPNAQISSSSTTISGSWGTLDDENDKVTLYVSQRTLVINSDGTITCNQVTVFCASDNGSNKTVSIPDGKLSVNNTYNAALIVTSNNAVNYRIFGPVKTFTQDESNLKDVSFNIRDLNNCIGVVSDEATYTENPPFNGIYRFDKPGESSKHDTFLVKYETDDPNTQVDPPIIICKNNNSRDVVLAEWVSDNDIHLLDPNEDIKILSVNQCLWTYNMAPPNGAAGQNRWCLSSNQSTSSTNQNVTDTVCLARSGTSSLEVITISDSGQWLNNLYDP